MFGTGLLLSALANEEAEADAGGPRGRGNRRRFVALSDPQWQALENGLRDCLELRDRGGDPRCCMDAALSVMVGNCQWSELPTDTFGDWKIAYNRTERWIERGVWSSLARSPALDESWRPLILGYVERRNRSRIARSLRRTRDRRAPAPAQE